MSIATKKHIACLELAERALTEYLEQVDEGAEIQDIRRIAREIAINIGQMNYDIRVRENNKQLSKISTLKKLRKGAK